MNKAPDQIQKAFWQYRRFWLGTIALLVAGRFLLPHIPILRGWESRFTAQTIEFAKQEIPRDAVRIARLEKLPNYLTLPFPIPEEFMKLDGTLAMAAWLCKLLKKEGLCVRCF